MILLAMKERMFARRAVRRLLRAHSTISAARPDLSGKALYKEILLRTGKIDEANVDRILRRVEHSIDEWTAPGRTELQFREVVHYFVFSQYVAAGHRGSVVSFRAIVDALVPPNI